MATISVPNGQTVTSQTVSSGTTYDVLAGGMIATATVLSGGSITVETGGIDSGSTISAGGTELVYGSANADIIAGIQTVSAGTGTGIVTNETVLSGGSILLAIKSTSASNTRIMAGGTLGINGAISATNTTLSGGTIVLSSAKATLSGSLVFAGGGTLDVIGNTSAGSGDLAVISGFAAGDVIDMTAATSIGVAASASLTTTISGGNTVATVSAGTVNDRYIFSGTSIGATLVLQSDGGGGRELVVSGTTATVTSVGAGATVSNLVVSSGAPVTVYNGGAIVSATELSGGQLTISSGGMESSTIISAGGSETLLGSATNDSVFGSQTIGATGHVAAETLQSGGSATELAGGVISGITVSTGASLTVSGTASAVTIAGGTVTLATTAATLAGGFAFNGSGTLNISGPSQTGAGDQAVISGFYYGDTINLQGFGTGGTLATTVSGGNTVAVVTSAGVMETLTFSGSVASNLTLTSSGGAAEIAYVPPPTTTVYTPGDLVLSIYGNGAGTGIVGLDQAAPITLEEITTTGQIVSQQVLPQTTTVVGGVTEYAISGEYQSASEGILNLSVDGRSLSILGYGVTASDFNAANGATIYGTAALGQTTSLLNTGVTQVQRIVANISYNTTVDTSTSLTGVFNTNNPRSVATVNGTVFYIGGQSTGNDGTQGVFVAADGAATATAIWNNKTDVRDVAIINGQLYTSVDSKLNGGAGLYSFGTTLPTATTAPILLTGLGATVTLSAGQGNTANLSTGTVNLSPEQYYFADANTLYIADGGVPKEGGVGDGGLQKWSLIGGTWTLDYTLSQGLNLVNNAAGSGTTGLVGLTGTTDGAGNVILYATNETAAETDPSFLYGITDSLAATTLPTSESFTLLETAAPGSLIRGVAFAPTAAGTTAQVTGTIIVSSGVTSSGLTIGNGGGIIVQGGGTISGTTLLSGAVATISAGGRDNTTFIAHGATETVLGATLGDTIDGTQTAGATATINAEIIENGGALDLFTAGAAASGTVVNSGGVLAISGNATATDTTISGGAIYLQSTDAVLSGGLTFAGTGDDLKITAITGSGFGALATLSGFGASDIIDETQIGTGATLSTTIVGSTVSATITSGAVVETFTFAGSAGVSGSTYAAGLSLVTDGGTGVELIYTPPAPVNIIVSSGVTSSGLLITSGNSITVLSGGTMSGITIAAGGSANINVGGEDLGTTIQAGGYEVVSGDANGDQIYGIQNVTTGGSAGVLPATVEGETVFNGGTLELYLKPDVASGTIVSSGGTFLLSGNVSATDTTLFGGATMTLKSPKAVFNGGITFSGAATLNVATLTSAGFGPVGVISGWQAGDIIDETLTSATVATVTTTTVGGNIVETISGGLYPQSFTFAGTAAANIGFVPDGTGGVELTYVASPTACFATGTRLQTEHGLIAVEALEIGCRMVTNSGALRPIVWIGHRTVDIAAHPQPQAVQPIRIAAHAFGSGLPHTDLVLSPEHAIFCMGVLIPAGELVNTRSITQLPATSVTYWHVELDSHDIILAEGLPVESYLENGNRCDFEGEAVSTLHPMFQGSFGCENPCAPVVRQGGEVEAARIILAYHGGTMLRRAG